MRTHDGLRAAWLATFLRPIIVPWLACSTSRDGDGASLYSPRAPAADAASQTVRARAAAPDLPRSR